MDYIEKTMKTISEYVKDETILELIRAALNTAYAKGELNATKEMNEYLRGMGLLTNR